MSLISLLEKITGKQKQREKARIDDFRSLVRAIADGKEPDADLVDTALTTCGKSLDDLRTAVELLQKRKALKASLDAVPKLEAEKADINKQIAKAVELFYIAEKKFEETTNPLRWRLQQIQDELLQRFHCPQQLIDTCPYDDLIERMKQNERALGEAHKQRGQLARELEEQKRIVCELRGLAEKTDVRADRTDYLERAEHRSKRIAELEAALTEVQKRIEELNKQQEAIRKEMLVP